MHKHMCCFVINRFHCFNEHRCFTTSLHVRQKSAYNRESTIVNNMTDFLMTVLNYTHIL